MKNDSIELWWLGAVSGFLTVLFGIAALFWPSLTLVTFVYLFSVYVLVWGVLAMIRGLVETKNQASLWWLSLLFGVGALGVGVYLVRHPLVTFTTLILLVGFTLVAQGGVDIVEGLFGNKRADVKWLSMLGGAVGVVAGVFVLTQPAASGVAFVWILGLYALLEGSLLIAMSLDEKNSVETNPVLKRA